MTNLIASIILTLVTNTVTTDNAVREPRYSGIVLNSYPPQYPTYEQIVTPATEKTDVVTVKEFRHLKFECEGKQFSEQLSERVVSEKRTTYQLKRDWQVSKETFEKDPEPKIYFATNISFPTLVFTNLSITNRLN